MVTLRHASTRCGSSAAPTEPQLLDILDSFVPLVGTARRGRRDRVHLPRVPAGQLLARHARARARAARRARARRRRVERLGPARADRDACSRCAARALVPPRSRRDGDRAQRRRRPSAGARVWPGRPYPLGATFDGYGTNFAVFSSVAERVELCLFDGERETRVDARPRHRPDLARVPAARSARAALRLPRPRPVGSGARPALQPEQAARRSRTRARSAEGLEWGPALRGDDDDGGAVDRGQRAAHVPLGRRPAVLRLGQRSPARDRRGTRR